MIAISRKTYLADIEYFIPLINSMLIQNIRTFELHQLSTKQSG